MTAQLPALLRLKSWMSVAQLVNRHIKHPLLQQAFSIHPLLVGGNPFDTTSIYALIHYLERRWGVWFCMGGTGKLVAELGQLMERAGVSIELNTDIAEITEKDGRVSGARSSDGRFFPADAIICNADPPTVYAQMLPSQKRRRKRLLPERLTRYSMGLFVLFFGTEQSYPDVAHHTIWMGKRYKSLLKDIFNRKILAEDFPFTCTGPPLPIPALPRPARIVFMCSARFPICKGMSIGKRRGRPCATGLSRR